MNRRPLTVEDCDLNIQHIMEDGDKDMEKVDRWLDTRLVIMKHGEIPPMEEVEYAVESSQG